MEKMPSARQAKNLSHELQDRAIDYGRPSFVTANPRGEPRELLRQFHFNYPFCPVNASPRLAIMYALDGTTDIDVDLPDGTILVSFTHAGPAGYVVQVSFDGTIAGAFAPNVPFAGIILNPPPAIGYMCYPNKQLKIRGSAASFLSIIPYISTEPAGMNSR